MDLALTLGYRSVAAMLRTLTAHELAQWETYARRFRLPQQRIEIALANMARLAAGSSELADFVFDPRLREALMPRPIAAKGGAEQAANAMSGMFGGAKIVRLGAVPIGQERTAANG